MYWLTVATDQGLPIPDKVFMVICSVGGDIVMQPFVGGLVSE